MLFAVLAVAVARAGTHAPGLDSAVSAFVAPYRTAWLLAAALWVTTLGTGAALAGMAMVATGFLWAGRWTGLILPLWVAYGGAEAAGWIVKFAVGRARPVFLAGVASAHSPSFPSAHATVSAATLGFIAYAVARDLPRARARYGVAIGTVIVVALIDWSRVFLGVHFATDVIGGVLLGGAWLLIGLALADRGRSEPSRSGPPSPALARRR